MKSGETDSLFSNQIEFEVFLAKPPQNREGIDITLNWDCEDINNQEIFYTDSNAFGMVKRQTD